MPSVPRGERLCGWLMAAALLIAAAHVGYRLHREWNPQWYFRTFNPPSGERAEFVYPVTYVSVGEPVRGRFSATVWRTDTKMWDTTIFVADHDLPSYGVVPGTVEVIEDADDASMRVVETVEYRKNGDHFRRSYVVHVNPLGRAKPPANPGIWTQVDPVDQPRAIRLPVPERVIHDDL